MDILRKNDMKTILSIIPYALTLKNFFDMRETVKDRPRHHFFKSIPEWCVRKDNGHIDYTENYHQFTGLIEDDDKSKYFLFDIDPVDLLLKEEISNIGVEELFGDYDWRPLFKKISYNDPPHLNIRIPINVHVVVDIDYVGGDGDFDLVSEVLGCLDGSMNLSRI